MPFGWTLRRLLHNLLHDPIVLVPRMLRYSPVERRGRLDLRIGSVLNIIKPTGVTHVGAHLAEEA